MGKQFILCLGGWLGLSSDQNLEKKKTKKNLTFSVRASNFLVAQLFQRDDVSHTATGPRLCKTINASSLPLSLEPAWPPTTQQRLISEAYNCSSHAVNLAVFTSFLIETENPSLKVPPRLRSRSDVLQGRSLFSVGDRLITSAATSDIKEGEKEK